jgi:cyclase
MTRKLFTPSRAKRLIGIFAAATVFGAAGSTAVAFAQGDPVQSQNADGEVHVLPVRGNVYMLVGAGSNITVQVGDDGILLVDAGRAQMSDKVLAAVRSIYAKPIYPGEKPIHYLIDTTIDADHTGGNVAIAKAGSTPTGGNVVGNIGASAGEDATIIAYQGVLDRMSTPGSKDATPDPAWPTDAFTAPQKDLFFNNEAIEILHQPAAHTDGDSMVFFRRSDVVSTGDIFTTTNYPVVDLERGGSIQGIIDGLNRLVYQIAIPGPQEEGGTLVIPGHGRLGNQADVIAYQEMVIIIRDRIQALLDKGMTLEQVKAAKPTSDYDPRYGSTTGPWTTDNFVEAVYTSLKAAKH